MSRLNVSGRPPVDRCDIIVGIILVGAVGVVVAVVVVDSISSHRLLWPLCSFYFMLMFLVCSAR